VETRNILNRVRNSPHFPRAFAESMLFSIFTGVLFYRHYLGVILILFYVAFFIPKRIEALEDIERAKRRVSFLDFLSVIKRLSASGMAIQQCLIEAYRELRILYPEDQAWIMRSVYDLNQKLALDPYPGPYFMQWGEKDQIKEIEDFGQVLSVVQDYGGDMEALIGESATMISDRLETDNEIRMLAASKVFEQKVLFYLGYVMVAILNSVMPDMFQVLYTTFIGRCVMTFSLFMMLAGQKLGTSLTRIEV